MNLTKQKVTNEVTEYYMKTLKGKVCAYAACLKVKSFFKKY